MTEQSLTPEQEALLKVRSDWQYTEADVPDAEIMKTMVFQSTLLNVLLDRLGRQLAETQPIKSVLAAQTWVLRRANSYLETKGNGRA